LLAAIPTSAREPQARANSASQPGLRFGIVIEQCDEFTPRRGDALVVRRTKPAILLVPNDPRPKFGLRHVGRTVARTVVHHDRLETHVPLRR
jgi:hypothetical protein